MTTSSPAHTGALLRHFVDLREGSHGGATSRRDKERLFAEAVALLDPHARHALNEIDADLLLDSGEITATGVRFSATAGLEAVWGLSWPEQRAARHQPLVIRAYFGLGSPHPHLRGTARPDEPASLASGSRQPAQVIRPPGALKCLRGSGAAVGLP